MPASSLSLLLALAAAAPLARAFLDRQNGLNLFTLPELRSPHHRRLAAEGAAGAGYRHLREVDGAFPMVADAHEFVGATPLGFVVYNTSSILRATSVQTDDYLALLSTATLTCQPRAVPPEHQGQGHMAMRIAFPAGVADALALEHLTKRLALPEAVLVLGVDMLLSHPDLGAGGSCVAHAAGAAPYFALAAPAQRSGSTLTLDLSPASPQSAFVYLKVDLQHTPDVAEGVARRLAAGLSPGRALAITNPSPLTLSNNAAVNWNQKLGAAADANTKNLPFFSAAPFNLYCENCYFYLQATLNVELQVCAIQALPVAGATTYRFYDANLPESNPTGYSSDAVTDVNGVLARAQTDCNTQNTITPLAPTVVAGTALTLNMGMAARVWLSGVAGFSYTIKSNGVSSVATSNMYYPDGKVNALGATPVTAQCGGAAAATVACAVLPQCSGSSSSCTPALLPGTSIITLPLLSFAAGAAPMSVSTTIGLYGAAVASVSGTPYNLQMGTSATAAMTLGGGVSFNGLVVSSTPGGTTGAQGLSTPTQSLFTPTYTTIPFQLSGFNGVSSMDVTITPQITLALFATSTATVSAWSAATQTLPPGALQFSLRPAMNFKNTLAVSPGRAMRAATAADPRALSACAANNIVSTTTAIGSLGVYAANVKLLSLASALVLPFEAASTTLFTDLLTGTSGAPITLFPTTSVALSAYASLPVSGTFSTSGALDSGAASNCVAIGSELTTATSVSSTRSPSPSPTPSSTSSTSATPSPTLTTTRTPPLALPLPFAATSQDTLSVGMVSLLADPVGQANQVSILCTAAFIPLALGPLLFFLLPLQACLHPGSTFCAAACCQVRGLGEPGTAAQVAALAAMGPAQAAAYLLLQGAAALAAALTLPWATFTPTFTLPTMTVTGLALCTSAASATCTGANLVTAGMALLAGAGVLGLLACLVSWAAALRLRDIAYHHMPPYPNPCASPDTALVVALLATALALAGVVTSYLGASSLLGLIPAAVMAAAKVGPSPGGAAAILGLVCLVAGVAATALAGDASPKVLLGLPPPPPPPPYPAAAQRTARGGGSGGGGAPKPLASPRSLQGSMSPSASPRALEPASGAAFRSIYEDFHLDALQQAQAQVAQVQMAQQLQLEDMSRSMRASLALAQAQAARPPVTLVMPPSAPPAAATSAAHAQAYASAVERLGSIQRAALEAEQEVRLVEGAMRERAGRLAAVEAESLQRTGSAAAMLGRSPSRVMLQPQQQSFRGGESGRVSPTPRPEVLALVKMLPSTAFRMLRNKGALTAKGEVLQTVVLTEEEEDMIGNAELLIRLQQLNVIFARNW